MLSRDRGDNDRKKNFQMSPELFHEILDDIISLTLVKISYRLIEESFQRKRGWP